MPEPVLSARSPKYPALYDELSGVRFISGRARVSVEQARLLAERRFMDGIVIGEFDAEGRSINELPAKKWAAAHDGEPVTTEESGESGAGQQEPPSDDATDEGRRRKQGKE